MSYKKEMREAHSISQSQKIKNVNNKDKVNWNCCEQLILQFYIQREKSACKIGVVWTKIPEGTL